MKKYEPKISIIIPMYNSAKYIEQTLDSLINQTYKNIEILIIDDGSSDEGPNIVKNKYINQVKYIFQENSGAPMARNNGLSQAKGEYIVFFDADDLMEKNGIQSLASNLNFGDVDVVIGNYYEMDNDGNIMSIGDKNNLIDKLITINETNSILLNVANCSPFPGNKMFKKNFLLQNKLNFENLKIAQDLNFFLRCIACYPKISFTKNIVSYYRIHNGSISRSYDSKILDIIVAFEDVEKKNYSFYNKNSSMFTTLKFNHFGVQLYKIPLIKDRQNRIEVFKKLKYEIKKLDFTKINSQFLTINLKKVKFALKYGFIYTSNFMKYLY